jgi:hypothetical protein
VVWDAPTGAVRASFWRAAVDEDGYYCFAAALCCGGQRRALIAENATARDCVLRLLSGR